MVGHFKNHGWKEKQSNPIILMGIHNTPLTQPSQTQPSQTQPSQRQPMPQCQSKHMQMQPDQTTQLLKNTNKDNNKPSNQLPSIQNPLAQLPQLQYTLPVQLTSHIPMFPDLDVFFDRAQIHGIPAFGASW